MTLLSSVPERPALSLLAGTNPTLANSNGSSVILSDMDALAASLRTVQQQLARVLEYVRDVLAGKREGDPVVGRYVIDAVSTVPISAKEQGSAGIEEGATQLETLFNAHLQVSRCGLRMTSRLSLIVIFIICVQDVLMVSYLANVVRAQAEVASRLTLLT